MIISTSWNNSKIGPDVSNNCIENCEQNSNFAEIQPLLNSFVEAITRAFVSLRRINVRGRKSKKLTNNTDNITTTTTINTLRPSCVESVNKTNKITNKHLTHHLRNLTLIYTDIYKKERTCE